MVTGEVAEDSAPLHATRSKSRGKRRDGPGRGAAAIPTSSAASLDCLLSRAKIVSLPAGKRVYPHIDRGEYYRLRGRYHFVLRSTAGSWLKAADEDIRMREGELWWFDNDQMHEAHNDGDQDRIHMIFDMLPRARAEEVFGRAA